MTRDDFFTDIDVVSVHTSDEATEDGILVDITKINPDWEKGIFSHITVNLMSRCGYFNEDRTLNIPNLLDLLNQSLAIVRKKSDNFQKHDWHFDGEIELPSGNKQQVFIQQNETGKFTILLPEDY